MDTAYYNLSESKEHGGGEMKFFKATNLNENNPNYSFGIATEVMDNVLDNVFRIVVPIKVTEEKITTEKVHNIIKKIFSKSNDTEKKENQPDDTLLDENLKNIIENMKVPSKVVNHKKKGVGDQITNTEIILPKSNKHILEKKMRFMNLVRNSKYNLPNENENESEKKWIEEEEKLIKITDLDIFDTKDIIGSSSLVVDEKNKFENDEKDITKNCSIDKNNELTLSNQTMKNEANKNVKKNKIGLASRILKLLRKSKKDN